MTHKIKEPVNPHPSGRPIRHFLKKERPYMGVRDGPLTPRLQPHGMVSAIGFVHHFDSHEDDKE
jgi:hypothetical protein